MSTSTPEARPSSGTSPDLEGVGVPTDMGVNPMHSGLGRIIHQPLPFRLAPRCGARTRSGMPCQSPRVKG